MTERPTQTATAANRGQVPPRTLRLQLFASQERTERATPRRRQEARRRGQVAKSAELSTALVLLAAFITLYALAGGLARHVAGFSVHVFQDLLIEHDRIVPGEIVSVFFEMTFAVVGAVWPILLVTAVVGFSAQAAQIGFLTSADPIKPQLKRINPGAGFKRIFSKRALAELLKSALKVIVVGGAVFWIARDRIPSFLGFIEIDIRDAMAATGDMVFQLGWWAAVLLLVLAAGDFFYQRWEFERSIRMSKQEVREDHRQSEGDPQIRAALQRRRRQLIGTRMMAEVPKADVVITNPIHVAVALKYDPRGMDAPQVVAKGAGAVAERIKETAKDHGVPTVQNVWLARTLYESAEIGDTIPEDLYQAVAEVLAFVYRLKRSGAG